MKASLIFLVLLFLAATSSANAQQAETIDHVTDDNVIVLQNGQAYESTDVTSETWNSGDEVVVLNDDTIVNKDTNEAVDTIETSAPDEDDDPE